MMDLLKRFEEDSSNDDPFANPEYDDDEGAGGDADDDDDDSERRLAGIDLGESCCFYPGTPRNTNTCRECFRG
jgi:hypothetical protein